MFSSTLFNETGCEERNVSVQRLALADQNSTGYRFGMISIVFNTFTMIIVPLTALITLNSVLICALHQSYQRQALLSRQATKAASVLLILYTSIKTQQIYFQHTTRPLDRINFHILCSFSKICALSPLICLISRILRMNWSENETHLSSSQLIEPYRPAEMPNRMSERSPCWCW